MPRVPFTKLTGAGNEFILVDTIRQRLGALETQWRPLARTLCDRRRGVGADGLLVLSRSRRADVRMRIFNPDGTEPSMCGNGVRCLAWYVHRRNGARQSFSIETRSGIRQAQVRSARAIRINMGIPRILRHIPRLVQGGRRFSDVTLIDSGVPHLVCGVTRVARIDVEAIGRRLRRHPTVQPQGANVDFVEYVAQRRSPGPDGRRSAGMAPVRIQLKMRTYERGVEGETQACGTGAVAAAVTAVRAALARGGFGNAAQAGHFEVEIRVPGGTLRVMLGAVLVPQRRGRGRSFDSALRLAQDRGERAKRVEPRLVFSSAFLEGDVRQVARGTVTWNGRRMG